MWFVHILTMCGCGVRKNKNLLCKQSSLWPGIVDFGSARGATVSVVCCEAEQGFGLKKAVGVLQIHNCGCLGGPEVAVCALISILGCNLCWCLGRTVAVAVAVCWLHGVWLHDLSWHGFSLLWIVLPLEEISSFYDHHRETEFSPRPEFSLHS